MELAWHFFATSHGKGAVDGIGGIAKRSVWRAVCNRKCIVTDAKSFTSVAKEVCKGITFILVTSEEILKQSDLLQLSTIFNTSIKIPNIIKVHFIEAASKGIHMRYFSSDPNVMTHADVGAVPLADNSDDQRNSSAGTNGILF